MSYDYSYIFEEVMESGVIGGLLSGTPSFLLSVAMYVFGSLGLYTLASRRGIRNPWLAWIPVVNVWIIGSLSDQYRYVVKGEEKNKRKTLLILHIINFVLGIALLVFLILLVVGLVRHEMYNYSESAAQMEILRSAIGMGCVGMILTGTAIALAIIRYMALYDIYCSMDPANCVLFTVLSILFGITEPFFLFFNRNKDLGMPPRRQEEVYREYESVPEYEVYE
jgi:hypothetical protein